MGRITEEEFEKWERKYRQVLQIIKTLFTGRWCNMNVAIIKTNTVRQRSKDKSALKHRVQVVFINKVQFYRTIQNKFAKS